MNKLLIILALIFTLNSCTYQYETEEFELRQFTNVSENINSSSGSFFIIAGGYSSKNEYKENIKLFAKVDGTYRYLEFDLKKVRIKIDNSINIPTIKIFYKDDCSRPRSNDYIFNYEIVNNSITNSNYVILSCPEIYLPEKLVPIDITKQQKNERNMKKYEQ